MSTYATSRAVSRPAPRDRVIVDGVDITWFRGKHTPVPAYQLQEPFAYGATRLPLPQIHAGYEALGVGELSWIRKGARVLYQRIDADDNITTDYRGRVLDIVIDGATLSLNIGGAITGPASLTNEQPPRFRKVRDLGRFVWNACNDIGVNLEPYGGPETGILIPDRGGMTTIAWLEELGALSQDTDGLQRALMPVTWGGNDWHFNQKDYTTVHYTAYNDDARVTVKVSDAAAEAPNRFFGTGITPAGVRVFNGRYPGIQQGTPPPYPMAAGAPFGIGTTDADTLTGEGITIMYSKLVTLGYVEAFDFAGVYTSAIAAGVAALQRDAGLTDNGIMGVAGWNALYDLSITGYSFLDARIFPMAIDPKVRPWNYTSTGNYLDRNDAYDPSILRTDRNIDFGAGMTKPQMLDYSKGLLTRSLSTKNWVGQIRLDGSGVFAGGHSAADHDDLTADDLVPFRDIRPGTNIRLPLFDGDTLFHISGIDVDSNGATLWVDTQARDLMEVAQIIARNAESRRDIRREWYATNRGGKPSGNMVTRDEFFGQVFNNVELDGDNWNVVPVPMGQHGQVNRTEIHLTGNFAFAMAVFSRPVTARQLNHRIPNPLAKVDDDGVAWYEDEAKFGDWFDRRTLLYAAGTYEQPCGYWPRKHTNDKGDVTSAPRTGDWMDDSGWPYICGEDEQVVVYLAIYPASATTLRRGQVFWAQEDDAV